VARCCGGIKIWRLASMASAICLERRRMAIIGHRHSQYEE
jgi:hypothetical protein